MDAKIVVDCDNCHRKLRMNASHAGKRVRCPACQAVLTVPVSAKQAPESTPSLNEPRRPSRQPQNSPRKAAPPAFVSDDMWLNEPKQELDEQGLDEQDDWGDESNPYAPPKAQTRPRSTSASTGFSVENKLIRCGPEVRLPAICIRTGARSELTEVTKTLKHAPQWAFLVGGVILMLIMQKSCKVSYFVSASEKKRQMKWFLVGIGCVVCGLFFLISGGLLKMEEVLIPIGILMMLGGLITVIVNQQPLKITKRDGSSVFWISGCKPAFFETLSGRS